MNKKAMIGSFFEKFLWIAFAVIVAIGIYFLFQKLTGW